MSKQNTNQENKEQNDQKVEVDDLPLDDSEADKTKGGWWSKVE